MKICTMNENLANNFLSQEIEQMNPWMVDNPGMLHAWLIEA